MIEAFDEDMPMVVGLTFETHWDGDKPITGWWVDIIEEEEVSYVEAIEDLIACLGSAARQLEELVDEIR